MPPVPVATSRSARQACAWLATAMAALAHAPALAQAPVALVVDFAADGGCTARAGDRQDVRGVASAPFRCDLEGLPPKTPVALTLTLPPGMPASQATFPRVAWALDGDRLRGRAALPAAPAFVRVPVEGASSGWLGRWLDLLSLAATALAVAWSLAYGRRA